MQWNNLVLTLFCFFHLTKSDNMVGSPLTQPKTNHAWHGQTKARSDKLRSEGSSTHGWGKASPTC